MNKLTFKEITKIYEEALENETGMPVNLMQVFDFDGYELRYDSTEDKTVIKIKHASIQFEFEDEDIIVVNYGYGSGWQMSSFGQMIGLANESW
jgi:hypothetical protein